MESGAQDLHRRANAGPGRAASQGAVRSAVSVLPLVVVAGNRPSLFARNWLESLRLNCQAVSAASASAESINSLLETHAEIFKDELGTIK